MKFFTLFLAITFSISTIHAVGNLQKQIDEKKKKMTITSDVVQTMKKGIEDLKSSGIVAKAIKTGQYIPPFYLSKRKGHEVSIKKLYRNAPLVLTFYRGGWCSYCKLELKEYERLRIDFEKAGAQIIAVGPDSYREIRKLKDKLRLGFDIYRDKDNAIAKKMGIAFKLDEGTTKLYKSFGINLARSQGNNNNELPMPGTYVINQRGQIIYAFIDPDYRKRAEPADVLKFVYEYKKEERARKRLMKKSSKKLTQ